jgi:hypothetical protein
MDSWNVLNTSTHELNGVSGYFFSWVQVIEGDRTHRWIHKEYTCSKYRVQIALHFRYILYTIPCRQSTLCTGTPVTGCGSIYSKSAYSELIL